jgi:dCMP deaminase
MTLARDVSTRSTCTRRRVGALIVKDRRILSTGYNGAPTGLAHCTPETCLRTLYSVPSGERHELCRGLHAEQNAVIQAAYHGVSIAGAMIYVTHHPCSICAKILINSGIKRVVYGGEYQDSVAVDLFNESGIELEPFGNN